MMKILIIKLSSIGDVVHTIPSLFALKELFPDSEIDWLAEEESYGLLHGHHLIHNLWVLKRKRWLKASWNGDGLKEMFHLVRGMRRRRYDLVIDFQGLLKSGVMAFLIGRNVRLGYDRTRELSYYFLNDRLPPLHPDTHAIDKYLNIVKNLGWQGEGVKFYIPVAPADQRRVEDLLESKGLSNRERMVLISPRARWETKLWGVDKFAALCDELIEKFRLDVIMVGGEDDQDYIREILALMKNRAIDVSGKTNLRELAYLINISPILICLDSGPLHIADAVETKTIALFGPTSPLRTGPYGKSHIVIRKEVSCSPCFLRHCDEMTCMREIEVEEVLEAVRNIECRIKN